jgi:hypothetical protein
MRRWERLSPREQCRFEEWVPARYTLWMRLSGTTSATADGRAPHSVTPRPRATRCDHLVGLAHRTNLTLNL